MKKWILSLLTIAGTVIAVLAQDLASKDVPAPVATAFKSKYAGASDTKWKLTKGGTTKQISNWKGKRPRLNLLKEGNGFLPKSVLPKIKFLTQSVRI